MTSSTESAPQSEQGHGKQQSASKRFVFTPWNDSLDREICAHAEATGPDRVPAIGRTGLATARWIPVDRTDNAILICNRLHEGECAWPYAVGSA